MMYLRWNGIEYRLGDHATVDDWLTLIAAVAGSEAMAIELESMMLEALEKSAPWPTQPKKP